MSSKEINISSSKSSKHSKKHCKEGKRKRDRRHKREERMLLEGAANQNPTKKIATLNCESENLNEAFQSPSSRTKFIVKHKANENEENSEELEEHTNDDQDLVDDQEKVQSGRFEESSGKLTEEGFEEQSEKLSEEFGEQFGEESGVDDKEGSYSTKFPKVTINYTQSKASEYYVEFVGKYKNIAKNEFYCHGRLTQGQRKEARAETSIKTKESFQKKKHHETGDEVKERSCTPANLNMQAPSIFPIYVHLFVLIFHLIMIAWHIWSLFLAH